MKKVVLIIGLLLFVLIGCDDSEYPPPGNSNDQLPHFDSFSPSPLEIIFTLLMGQDTVEIHTTWIDAGALFRVNGQESKIMGSSIDTSQLGLHTVKYEATHDGKTHRAIRYVMVTDQTPPVITLNPGVDTIELGETWYDAGASVLDNSGETVTIQVTGEVNTEVVGTYVITYIAIDSSGNMSSVDRYVNVIVNTYTVIFYEENDIIFKKITANYGTPLDDMQNPKKIGHTFRGWYTDLAFENEFNLLTIPRDNFDLFAKWERNKYTLNYQTDQPFIQISTDIWGSSYLSQNGDLYFGGNQTEDILNYIDIRENEKIIDVFIGSVHRAILTSTGRIFKWGFNGNGEFGDGSFVSSQIPVETTLNFNFLENEEIKEISLGYQFSSLLTSTGRVFMWGFNQSGQVGNGNEVNQSTPNDITSKFNLNLDEIITQISVGWDHSMALSNDGRVFTWGHNPNGELGLDPVLFPYMNRPVEITSNFNLVEDEIIIQISSGRNHNAVLTSLNRVFTWGDNGSSGKLGDGTQEHSFLPVEITNNFDLNENELVVSLFVGGFHSGALSNQGRLFTWGHNIFGQVGDGTTDSRFLPLDITPKFDFHTEERILKFSGGWDHSVVLTSRGRIFEWGKIDYAYNSESGQTQLSPLDITSQILGVSFFLKEQSLDFETLIELILPTKEGYTFGGWYVDSQLTIAFTATTMPAQDITLYSRWIPNE